MAENEVTGRAIVQIMLSVMKDPGVPFERLYEALANTLVKLGVKSEKEIENAVSNANNPLLTSKDVEKIGPAFRKKLREAEEKAAAAAQKKEDDVKQARLVEILVKLKAVLDSYTGGTDRGFYSSVAKAALDAGVKDEAELRKVMDLGSGIETFSLFSEDFVGAFNILKDSQEVASQEAVQEPGIIGVRARGLPAGLIEIARKAEGGEAGKEGTASGPDKVP